MNPNSKRTQALELLARKNIWRSNYAPPMHRLLWRLDFDVPPPHFASFFSNALLLGVYFTVAYGLFMWLVLWSNNGTSLIASAIGSVTAGVLFGLVMAGYYHYGHKKYNLPSWEHLSE